MSVFGSLQYAFSCFLSRFLSCLSFRLPGSSGFWVSYEGGLETSVLLSPEIVCIFVVVCFCIIDIKSDLLMFLAFTRASKMKVVASLRTPSARKSSSLLLTSLAFLAGTQRRAGSQWCVFVSSWCGCLRFVVRLFINWHYVLVWLAPRRPESWSPRTARCSTLRWSRFRGY